MMINHNRLLVRKPQSGSLSKEKEKKENLSPNNKFIRKPSTSTNLPFYSRSPMKIKNQQIILINKQQQQHDPKQQHKDYQKLMADPHQQYSQQQQGQEQKIIGTTLLQQQQIQSLSSGNTSDQYSVINQEDQFLTSFNTRFIQRDNIEKVLKQIQIQKQDQNDKDKNQTEKEKEKWKNTDRGSNDQQSERVNIDKKEQANEHQSIATTNNNILKSSYHNPYQQCNISSITWNRSHIYQNLSYQISNSSSYSITNSLSQQNHKQQQQQYSQQLQLSSNLSKSKTNNNDQLSTEIIIKANNNILSSKLVKIQQQPSQQEQQQQESITIIQHQQSQLNKYQQIIEQNNNLIAQNLPIQQVNIFTFNNNQQKQQQQLQQVNPNNYKQQKVKQNSYQVLQKQNKKIEKNKVLDSFGINILSSQNNEDKNKDSLLLLSSNQPYQRIERIDQYDSNDSKQYAQVGDMIIRGSVQDSIQSHYNRNKYYSYYQEQQHDQDYEQYDDDSQIQTSQSIYTITQPDISNRYNDQQSQQQQQGGYSNFYYHYTNSQQQHQSSQSSSSSKHINSRNNNHSKNFKQYHHHQRNKKQKHKINNNHNYQYRDQFYNVHMNKLDNFIVQILQMKKHFQLHYLNNIRQQNQRCQQNNIIIMKQLQHIQNKLNPHHHQLQDININNNTTNNKTNRQRKANKLIKYSQKQYQFNKQNYHHQQPNLIIVEQQQQQNNLQSSIVDRIKDNSKLLISYNNKQKQSSLNKNNNQQPNLKYKQQSLQQSYAREQQQRQKEIISFSKTNNKKRQRINNNKKRQRINNNKKIQRLNRINNNNKILYKQQQQNNNKLNSNLVQRVSDNSYYYEVDGWQCVDNSNDGGVISDCSIYSSNRSIHHVQDVDQQLNMSNNNNMLSSIPYLSKVINNKKQLKQAIKTINHLNQSIVNQSLNQYFINQSNNNNNDLIKSQYSNNNELLHQQKQQQNNCQNNEYISINNNNITIYCQQQSKQSYNQQQVEQQQYKDINDLSSKCISSSNDDMIKCIQTVYIDDYYCHQLNNSYQNKQTPYLTDGFLTQLERQTIMIRNHQHQLSTQSKSQQQQHKHQQQSQYDCLINAVQQSITTNNNKQSVQSEQSKEIKQSKCLITQPQTINTQLLSSITQNQQITTIIQPIISINQPINHIISFNKKLKQGKHTKGQTCKISDKQQQQTMQSQLNNNNNNNKYLSRFNDKQIKINNNKLSSSKFSYLNQPQIQILPDCPIYDSIYYQRQDKQLYKYKWYKFK